MLIFYEEINSLGCTLSPNTFKVCINDLIVAVGAKQGVAVGEDTVSGLMFADNFVGISGRPEGLQHQIEKALKYSKIWRVRRTQRRAQYLYVTKIR